MNVSGPVLFKLVGSGVAVAECGNIVGQCINPYIYNVFVVERYRNTPLESRSGNAQILKSGFDEVVYESVSVRSFSILSANGDILKKYASSFAKVTSR